VKDSYRANRYGQGREPYTGTAPTPPPITAAETALLAPDRPALNESAIREFALRCSKAYRAGKFTRVGADFVDEVTTDVECLLRDIRGKYAQTVHPLLGQGVGDDEVFIVKGAFLKKLEAEVNHAICRVIQAKVQRQPTVGCTLGRTR
jgi:hypothetical protein